MARVRIDLEQNLGEIAQLHLTLKPVHSVKLSV